jgi:small subunit ribosomal protein S6
MQTETPTAGGTTQPPAPHAAGTRLREYETIFLIRPDLAEDLVDKTVERLRGVVTREGGKVLKVINMGKKKTAFEVRKHPRAIFIQMHYLGDSKMVAEFERNLRMTDDVLKYQSVKLSENVDPNTRAVEPDQKLPGDPEAPAHVVHEERGFGGGDRDGGFGGRDRGGPERDIPEAADEADAVEPD